MIYENYDIGSLCPSSFLWKCLHYSLMKYIYWTFPQTIQIYSSSVSLSEANASEIQMLMLFTDQGVDEACHTEQDGAGCWLGFPAGLCSPQNSSAIHLRWWLPTKRKHSKKPELEAARLSRLRAWNRHNEALNGGCQSKPIQSPHIWQE